MRVLFALPGLHRVTRGAETAFEQLAQQMASLSGYEVTLIGSGYPEPDSSYQFQHIPCIPREKFERWPSLPYLRSHFVYEELTFAIGLTQAYQAENFDVTVTCSYPYTNWLLRSKRKNHWPKHIFVTQNGDWMCHSNQSEYRHFGCDGLVCINPEYFERNREYYPSTLIPNGVNPTLFTPGVGDRKAFQIPEDRPVILIVSALSASKRVIEGIRCVAKLPDACLVLAGDGELRDEVEAAGTDLLGDRFLWLKLPKEKMPELYRCADLLLHMSQDEPFGNIYIEALATGLPIVAHDWQVTRWILEDQAIFVDTSDEQAVVEGIRQGLDLKTSNDVKPRRALVERRFTWSRVAEQYCEFFEKICSKS